MKDCPIMSGPVHSKFNDIERVFVNCISTECQWWHEENCIVFALAKSLTDLVVEVTKAGRPPLSQQPRRTPDDLSDTKPAF